MSEESKWKMPVFCQTKHFAYVRFSKNHVTLGFYHIDKIQEVDGCFEGEGNTLRHIKVKSLQQFPADTIINWLRVIAE